MCRSLAEGGRRCASGHPAVRAARRAASNALAGAVAEGGADHPATAAYLQAKAWADKTQQAVQAGDEDAAKAYAANAKAAAKASNALLSGKQAGEYPSTDEPARPRPAAAVETQTGSHRPAAEPEWPEHRRAAASLADAAGAHDATVIPRDDGGEGIAWSSERFNGTAAVYPGNEDEGGHPQARLVLSDMDRSSYEALAASPWPYRTEGNSVIYDRLPADQAQQVLDAARSGQAGRPWERHGLDTGSTRERLPYAQAQQLVPESSAWSAGLTPEEKHWVHRYTGSAYEELNVHLYHGRSLDEDLQGYDVPVRQVTTALDSALARAATPKTPHRTFRGFTPPQDVVRSNQVPQWARSRFQVGQVYRDDSYISVSHCPEVAADFSDNEWHDRATGASGSADHKVVFEVLTRRGAAVGALGMMGNSERERLLPRGSAFRVVGVHENAEVAGHKAVLIQLVDVHDIPRH